MNLFLFILKLFVAVLLLVPRLDAAEHAPRTLDKYFSQTWGTSEGLPHNSINALAQSQDGYLWIATWEGLARFNGREFTLFTRGSSAGLPDSGVRSLFTTSNGNLLIGGSRGGIALRKSGVWQPMRQASALVNHAIYDDQNNLWLALEEKGLVVRDAATQSDKTIIKGLRVRTIVQTSDGMIWAATNKGLYSVNRQHDVMHYGVKQGLPNVPAYVLMETSDRRLIVGTANGAFHYDGHRFHSVDRRLNNTEVSSLIEDAHHDIWFGTNGQGVFRRSKNGLENYDDAMGLPNNRVLSLHQDKEHNMWIGTSAGLHRLRDAPFITLTDQHGLAGNYVRSVLSHADGSLWVGSSKGLNRIVEKQMTKIEMALPQRKASVLSLEQGKDGQVLVGTYTQGVLKVENGHLTPHLEINRHLNSNEVRSILYDSRGNTWIGTTAGVVKISASGDVEHINQQSGLPANFIMALAEDSRGQIWIGTGVGVVSYHDGALKAYEFMQEFGAEYAFSFYSTADAMWMATDRGVLRVNLDDDHISAIRREEGLPIDKVFQIVVDDNSTMWLTTNRGVIKVTDDEVQSVLDANVKSINYQMFGEGAGMLSSQANGGSTPAAVLHADGTVWVATAKGVSRVNSKRLNSVAQYQLPLVIEQLVVDGISYPINNKKQVTLPAGASHIAIYYAGLGFVNAEHTQYQTRLSGLAPKWFDKKNQTYAEFTNLRPGEYTFSMRAKYQHGEWRDEIVSLSFNIEYFFWQTLWFRLAVVLLLILMVYAVYRYRLVKIERNEQRLTLLVEKQTLELKRQAESFAYQATHDQLTGLPNRRAFDGWCDSAFEQAKLQQQPLSFAIIDIDHFKRVNDQYSHLIGDKVIQIVANTLLQRFATSDIEIKLARWGGEEFTALIYGNKETAFALCDELRATVEEYYFEEAAVGLDVTISIGLTDNQAANGYEKMISLADKALYRAKKAGRNQVKVYDEQSNDLVDGHNRRESDRF